MNVARSTVKLLLARSSGMVLTFGGLALFSRVLTPYELGVFFLFQALLNALSLPTDLGISGALEKRISEGTDEGRYLTTGLLLQVVPIIAISVLVVLFRQNILNYVGNDVAYLLVAGLLLYQISELTKKALNAEHRVNETAKVIFAQKIVWVGGSLVLIRFLESGSQAVIYGWIFSLLAQSLLGTYKLSISPGVPSADYAWSLFEYAKFDVIAGGGWRIFNWLDVLVIGFILTQELVSAYEIAWKLTAFTLLLTSSLRTVIFPQVSTWDSEGESGSIEYLLTDVLSASLFIVVPAFFGTVIFAEEILAYVFTPEYGIADIVLIILMFLTLVRAVEAILGRTLQAVDRVDLAAYNILAGAALNIILNPLLVFWIGIEGAALATLSSYVLLLYLNYRFVSAELNLTFPIRDILWYVFSSGAMAALLILLKSRFGVSSLSVLLVYIGGGAAMYVGTMSLYPKFRSHLLERTHHL